MEGVQVFVGLGSNLDDPVEQVRSALIELQPLAQDEHVLSSPLYRSRPMGPADQPDYINAVAGFTTTLTALGLLARLQEIELSHGRSREGERWGPRTLDLDMLLYGRHIIDDPELTIPHPGLHLRAFVLQPLYDIAPTLAIPGKGRLEELVASIRKDDIEKLSE
jgi:2-amino-4-hydroxy-6-hydroxymethyldihydropteridine diphosphokinase